MDNTILTSGNRMIAGQDEPASAFEGFTLDEIRHQRALIAVRKEFAKAKAFENVDMMKQNTPFAKGGVMKSAAHLSSIPLKLMKGLNYTDYILLGFSAFSTVKKIYSLFRRKKR